MYSVIGLNSSVKSDSIILSMRSNVTFGVLNVARARRYMELSFDLLTGSPVSSACPVSTFRFIGWLTLSHAITDSISFSGSEAIAARSRSSRLYTSSTYFLACSGFTPLSSTNCVTIPSCVLPDFLAMATSRIKLVSVFGNVAPASLSIQ